MSEFITMWNKNDSGYDDLKGYDVIRICSDALVQFCVKRTHENLAAHVLWYRPIADFVSWLLPQNNDHFHIQPICKDWTYREGVQKLREGRPLYMVYTVHTGHLWWAKHYDVELKITYNRKRNVFKYLMGFSNRTPYLDLWLEPKLEPDIITK